MKTKVAAAASAGTALWLSIGVLTLTDADTASRIGFLPPWWLLVVLTGAALTIIVGLRIPNAVCLPLFLSLLIVLPWLPVPVPDVVLAMTGPAVAVVWGAIVSGMLVVSLPSAPPHWMSVLRSPATAAYASGVIAFGVFLAVWAGQRLPPTGDEPHYLVTAQSLLRDGDVKVANNYQRGDYLAYYGGPLTPHYSERGVDGELYPGHGVGLSVMLVPLFAVGGYRAVVVWIAVMVAIGTALIWKAGHLLTGDTGAAWFGWAVVALTAPVVMYGSLIYPDSIAGVVFALCALAVVQADARVGRPAPWPLAGSFALGAALGVLAWVHVRLALPASIFAGVLLARAIRFRTARWTHAAAIAAPFALSVGAFVTWSWIVYGTLNPAASAGDRSSLLMQRIPVGLLALLTDQEFGLLPNAPVHLLSIAALMPLVKRHQRLGVDLLLIVVPYVLTLSAWSIWWAGACPPARFLVPVIFPLGVVAAELWARQSVPGRALCLTLLGGSIAIAAMFAWSGDGALAYNDGVGRARWLQWMSPLVDLSRGAPSFFRAGTLSPTVHTIADLVWPTLLWCLAALGGWALFVALDKRLALTTSRGAAAAACMTLAAAVAVTGSWRVVGGTHVTPTRVQLDVLRHSRNGLRPLGIQFSPWQIGRGREFMTRMAITTPAFERTPHNTLLLLGDVPAGDYRLEVARTPRSRGELALAIGPGTHAIERWPVSDEWTDYRFHLAASAATLVVTGDEDALHSVRRVALAADGEAGAFSVSSRARDAARYGANVVYALDDRVSLEEHGFWVIGERRPDVVVSAARPVSFFDVTIDNRPVANTVRVRSGRWYVERSLEPDERWQVRVPLAEPARDIVLGFDVAHGTRPADLNPSSRDRRFLGSWIEIR